MADAVTTRVLLDTAKQHVVHLTNISDGTGEAAVIKVDKSTIAVATDGVEADSLELESARWCIQGFTSVRILADHTTDDTLLVLSGNGYDDFTLAGAVKDLGGTEGLKDPRSTGGTGDVLLTTAGAIAGATYDITLAFRKATV